MARIRETLFAVGVYVVALLVMFGAFVALANEYGNGDGTHANEIKHLRETVTAMQEARDD